MREGIDSLIIDRLIYDGNCMVRTVPPSRGTGGVEASGIGPYPMATTTNIVVLYCGRLLLREQGTRALLAACIGADGKKQSEPWRRKLMSR